MTRNDSRESPSPFESRNRNVREKSISSNPESLQDEFDEQRRRHDESTFFAGEQKMQKCKKNRELTLRLNHSNFCTAFMTQQNLH